MKCPVCDNIGRSMVCPKCGFDSSRDLGRYPTLAPGGKVPSASALREQWRQKQISEQAVPPVPPPPARPPRRKGLWLLTALVCAVVLGVGIWIGLGIDDSGNWKENVLRSDMIAFQSEDPYDWADEAVEYSVFGSEYERWEIGSVTFLDTLKNMPNSAWDVSVYGDGSVMAWVKLNGDFYDLYIGANGGINGAEACAELFMGYINVMRIDFGDAFHTDGATDMHWMFAECISLESVDLSGLDTSNVQDMYAMFENCMMLTDLDLSGFDTSRVLDMNSMFFGCESLKHLDLSGFDTRRVWDMGYMFCYCVDLRSVSLGSFDTGRVEDMGYMFAECRMLQSLDLSRFDTAMVEDTTDMFLNCPAGDDWGHLLK